MNTNRLISIVDDDESVRESLENLLKSMGYRVRSFAGAEEFLQDRGPEETDCLILDVRLGGMSGPELHRKLLAQPHAPPTIFITAHGTAELREKMIVEGAVDCLMKPFSEERLVHAVNLALSYSRPGKDVR